MLPLKDFPAGASDNLPADTGDVRDLGSNPGSGRSLGEDNSYPLQLNGFMKPYKTF